MKVYINGKLYEKGKAKVSVFDHGYLYGDGIYETLRAYEGMVFKFPEHMVRLNRSATMMEMALPLDDNGLYKAVHDTLEGNELKDAYIRISVSRGPGEIGLDPGLCTEPTLVIIAKPIEEHSTEMRRLGAKVSVVKTRRNHPECLNPAIKSTNFLNNIFAKIEAKRAGAFEGIMLNHASYIAEGTTSNVFIVKDGALITPPLIAGILEGVTRDLIIRLAGGMGLAVFEELFTEVQLWQADEAFITSSIMEIMPVTQVDDHLVGTGAPGEVTQRLASAYKEEVRRCLKTE